MGLIQTWPDAEVSVLHLEMTTRCNATCPQCARMDPAMGYQHGTDHELTLAQVQELFSPTFVGNLSKMFACGNFGDPAASRHCLQIFDWFRTTNPSMTLGMNTNGGLKTRFWWQELADILRNNEDYVVFSIDGLRDTNGLYRRGVNWDAVMANAEYFMAAGGHAHWDMLVFEHNQHQVDECRELARKMGFTHFRAKVSNRFESRNVAGLNPPMGYVQPATGQGAIQCHAHQERSLYVSATGRVLPCCFIGAEVFRMTTDLETYARDYELLVDSWTASPHKICRDNCAVHGNSTRFKSQWQEESTLC